MVPSGKPKILVAILHQGWLRPELASCLSRMEADPRANVTVCYPDHKPSENNRNWTVQEALRGGYDYLISIDDDIIPLKNPIDLILLNLDVVGFACPVWNSADPSYPIYFVGMDQVEGGYREHKERRGLQRVDAVGSGCLVLSRAVMEAIKEPFVRKWEEGFAVTGLDFYFCEKARAAGFAVYCHYDYIGDHIKEVSLLEVLNFKHGDR